MDRERKKQKKGREHLNIINGGKKKEKEAKETYIPSWKKIQNAFTEGMKDSKRTVKDAIQDLEEMRKERNEKKDD